MTTRPPISRRPILAGLILVAPVYALAGLAWFATTDTAARMWTGFAASWPVWLGAAVLTWFAVWSEKTCRAYKRGQRAPRNYNPPADVSAWRTTNWIEGEK